MCHLLGQRVGDGHGVDQHDHKEGEEIEPGDQVANFLTIVVIYCAGDPGSRRDIGRENKLAQRFVRPVGERPGDQRGDEKDNGASRTQLDR